MKIFLKLFILSLFLFIPTLVKANTSPINISFNELKYSNEYINVDIKTPIVNYSNKEIGKKINSILKGDIISFKNQIEISAEESFKESKKHSFQFIPYEAIAIYETTFKNSKILSIPITFYTYTGGAHGNTIKEPYNFDLSTGNKIRLNNIFKENFDYKPLLKEYIKSTIEEDPDIFFDDAMSVIDKLDNNQKFYITNENLVVYYDLYEIAPYSSGIIEFKIPLAELKPYLNNYYQI